MCFEFKIGLRRKFSLLWSESPHKNFGQFILFLHWVNIHKDAAAKHFPLRERKERKTILNYHWLLHAPHVRSGRTQRCLLIKKKMTIENGLRNEGESFNMPSPICPPNKDNSHTSLGRPFEGFLWMGQRRDPRDSGTGEWNKDIIWGGYHTERMGGSKGEFGGKWDGQLAEARLLGLKGSVSVQEPCVTEGPITNERGLTLDNAPSPEMHAHQSSYDIQWCIMHYIWDSFCLESLLPPLNTFSYKYNVP